MRIALVQFYNYHEEVLAPQVDFLLPDNDVFIAAPASVFENYYIKIFDSYIKKIVFNNSSYDVHKKRYIIHRFISILIKYIRLFNQVKKQRIDLIVFNTITKAFHFTLIKFFFKKVEMVHIIHNAQNYTTEKAIRQLTIFKKNLFISYDVYNFYINNVCKNKNKSFFDWFLPTLIKFTSQDDMDIFSEIIIVVPGSVDHGRRNYKGFFEAIMAIGAAPPPPPPPPTTHKTAECRID
jgi:hypothetical protein